MKKFIFGTFIVIFSSLPSLQQHFDLRPLSFSPRERLLMDFGWRFAFGHAFDPKKDFNHATGYFSYVAKSGYGDGPASKNFDDRAWRILDLPHDWAVELPFDPNASYSHGFKTVGRNFPETSIGWYRRTFSIPESDLGKRISIEFDGVYRNATVWINGFYLGEEHSGYYGFEYDITDYLNYGEENVVAVRVDATMEEGWYYEGAGIYRHVWLKKTSPLHIESHGSFISCEVRDNSAEITARASIKNELTHTAKFRMIHAIFNAEGHTTAGKELPQLTLKPGERYEFSCTINVPSPLLWSVKTPTMYRLITTIESGDSTIDRYETPFGIRTLRFDAKEGFFLNGKHLALQGTNNHQDHAGVGTAIPDALQEFRVRRLKEMGCNAYRCSHNPPTPELLDVCDRLGMLVIDENRLMGTTAEHLDLLRKMIIRDRNHPSVFVWSIGNEEWAIEGNITGARIAETMKSYIQSLDPTRRWTYPNSGGWGNGISTVQDIMGFNYIFNGDIDKQHRDFPNQPAMGTEETTSRATRGVYRDDSMNAHMQPIDRKGTGHGVEEGLTFYAARPFLSGLFFWTGFDYRGEPHPYGWPQVTSQSGILDLCGFPKDMFYNLQSWWTDAPVLHISPHWNWKGREGETIDVWVYSNCDEVELFLNNKNLGRKAVPKNSHLSWKVPFDPGTLLARGYRNTKEIIADRVETTGIPAMIALTPDRSTLQADGEDVSVITVRMNDSLGHMVPDANNEIEFSLQGPGRIIGVGNGDPSSHEPDKYFEQVGQIPIENLKASMFPLKKDYTEMEIDNDDASWPSAINGKGEYDVKILDTLSTAIIRGTFTLPDFTNSTEISLWPKSLGEEQALFVNGRCIAKKIKRDDPVQKYTLDHSYLRNGKNIYTVVCTPLVKRFQYDNLNTDPGIVQILAPATRWKRKAFNGMAQVIVQSRKEPGNVTLTSLSLGLMQSDLKIHVQPATPRPAVP